MGSRGSGSTRPSPVRGASTGVTTTNPPAERQARVSQRQESTWRNSVYTAQAKRLSGGEGTPSVNALARINSTEGQDFVQSTLRVEQLLRNRNLSSREREALEESLRKRKAELRKAWNLR